MTLKILLHGIGIFFASFSIFFFLWKLRRPKNEILVLFIIFRFLPAIYFLIYFIFLKHQLDVGGFVDFIATAEICYALSLFFIQTYPVLKIEIPTFRILMLLDKNRENGLSKIKFMRFMEKKYLFTERIEDLEKDRLVAWENNKIILRATGRLLVMIFLLYRRL